MEWHKVADLDDLPDGRVRTVTVGRHSLALTRVGDRYGVLDNHCPHQGGPLGEGSIEKGLLRCPWHGYDYDPLTGTPPSGFSDAPACFPVEVRDDGVYAALPADAPHERTVSDVMVETMVAWGVTHVFGMVGHSNLGFADAMRRAEEAGLLTFVGIRHEGAAAFATSAYGKLTGRPAACFAIAGPGSTNLLTGLYDAKADRAPVLAISGQVPSKVLGRGAFQDVDLNAAFAAVARYSKTVLPESDHAELMTLALKTASVERDVAHLVLPDEVQELVVGDGPRASSPVGRVGDDRIAPPADALDDALRLIESARRPIIVVGHGVRFEMDAVRELAEVLHAPVLTTFKAKGLISDHHPLGAGVLGRSGTPVASWLMNESDLLIVLGASFSNHTGIAAYKPIVQVDFDPMALGRFHPVTVPVHGHAGVTARLLVERLAPGGDRVDQRPDVAARWEIWRAEKARRLQDDRGLGVSSAAVFDALNRTVPRRRGHRRRRRQPRVLVRALLRVHPAVDPDVRLPRVDRLRLPRRDGGMGRRRRHPQGARRHRRRRLRPVPRRDHDGGEVRDADHPRAARQPFSRQDHQGAARRRVRRLAHRPPQPRLRRVRRAVRSDGDAR